MSYIILSNGDAINPSIVTTLSKTDSTIKFELNNGKAVYERHASGQQTVQYFNYYLGLLNDYITSTLPIPSVETNMQTYYGESDTPTTDPLDINKPACYRGRLHNTIWFWDTEEKAWYPVVS